MSGRSFICCWSTRLLTCDVSRSTAGAVSALTVTSSVAAPALRTALSVDTCATVSSTLARRKVLKPSFLAVTSYAPTSRLVMEYAPVAPVVPTRTTFVERLRAVTCAPCTTAPLESVMVPLIAAVCAYSGKDNTTPHNSAKITKRTAKRGFIVFQSPQNYSTLRDTEECNLTAKTRLSSNVNASIPFVSGKSHVTEEDNRGVLRLAAPALSRKFQNP